MNLPDLLDPRKREGRGLYLGLIIVLIALGSFGLGRLSVEMRSQEGLQIVGERVPAAALQGVDSFTATSSATEVRGKSGVTAGGVVASKTGNKYFFPWCGGASAVKEENKVWFASEKEARKAGYQPASNCKGLQ